jgi:hypothetical protein
MPQTDEREKRCIGSVELSAMKLAVITRRFTYLDASNQKRFQGGE